MKLHCLTYVFIPVMLISSCNSHDKFPVTVSDIDTLSIYRNYHDSLEKVAPGDTAGSVVSAVQIQESKPQSSEKWTICTGVFRIRENAQRKFREINNTSGACLIIRDSMHLVTTGVFSTRDSALQFLKSHRLTNTYIIKITPKDQVLHSFPE